MNLVKWHYDNVTNIAETQRDRNAAHINSIFKQLDINKFTNIRQIYIY